MNNRKVAYLFYWFFKIVFSLCGISIAGCNLAPGFTNVYNTNQTWTFADGNSSIGINQSSQYNAGNSRLIVFNSQLYAIWSETNPGNIYQIRAALYNGNVSAPSWPPLEVNGVAGINFNSLENATAPGLNVFGGELYATWSETNPSTISQIRVAYYNGSALKPSWQPVDVNGTNVSGTNGINYNSGFPAATPQLMVFNGELYATWSENNPSNLSQIRVAVYNGRDSAPFWTFVDVNGINGINYNAGFNAYFPQLTVFNGELYAIWSEYNGTANQIRVAVYNGKDSAPLWTFVDGNGTNGINQNSANNAVTPQMIGFNSTLFATWSELNGTANQIRFSKYNGNDSAPVWLLADGGGTNGINFNSSFNATNPQLTIFGGDLYATWTEFNGTANQIRVAFTN